MMKWQLFPMQKFEVIDVTRLLNTNVQDVKTT